MESPTLDTAALFKPHFTLWRLIGITPPEKFRWLYWLYSIVVNIFATFLFPLSLLMGLLISTTMYEIIESLAISLAVSVCSVKTIAIWRKLKRVDIIFSIIRRQDEQLHSQEDIQFMKTQVYPTVRKFINFFFTLCIIIGITGEAMVLLNGVLYGKWRLLYHAYFPFDIYASSWHYTAAILYQFIAVWYIIGQNAINDTFAASHLALLGGHLRLLRLRVAKIGHDPKKSMEENNRDLQNCIRDHLDFLEYHHILQDVISYYMFFQLLFAGLNMCVVLVFMILFVKDPFTMVYYASYFTVSEQLKFNRMHLMETRPLDTTALFKAHFTLWRLLGITPPKKFRWLYWLYSVVVNILSTCCFPLTLLLGLFISTTMYEIIESLAISLAVAECSMKTIAIWRKSKKVDVIFSIIRRQDEQLHSDEHIRYMKTQVYPTVRKFINFFLSLCFVIGITGEAMVLLNGFLYGKWRLLYHAYFPFDIYASSWHYVAAILYQFVCVWVVLGQNSINDTFAASHLALLGGQVRLLCLRLAKIGHDPKKSMEENNRDLKNCIRDHLDFLEYHHILQDVISYYMFFQLLFAGLNMCVVLVFMILFVKDPFTMAYYASYFTGIVSEFLPSCYFGEILEEEFQNVAYSAFSCNWTEQNLEFRKNLRIFMENSRQRVHTTAWMFRINNNSFTIACKNAYSIFALIMNMR